MMAMSKTLKKWLVVISCILVTMGRRRERKRFPTSSKTPSRCRDFFEIWRRLEMIARIYNIEKDDEESLDGIMGCMSPS